MANDIQLKLLRTGVTRWNRWRARSVQIKVELNGADLTELHLNKANFSQANLCDAAMRGAHLNQADLTAADLNGACLSDVHLSRACLTRANLSNTNLTRANLNKTQLTGANLQNAQLIAADLSGADLSGVNLSGANLIGADLSDAKLQWANLSNANLIGADLTGADLSNANLSHTQVLATDFTAARLTGACLERWNTNSSTQFSDIECQYVYLREPVLERCPRNGEFTPGEFTRLFQKALETADLTFADGIDWAAFFGAFKKLQAESGEAELSIQAIEKQDDGILVIKIKVPPQTSKAGTKEFLRREYKRRLNAIDKLNRSQSHQVEIDRQKNTDLVEIIRMLAGNFAYPELKSNGKKSSAKLPDQDYQAITPIVPPVQENGSHSPAVSTVAIEG